MASSEFRHSFWVSARVLLGYKRQLFVALIGAIVSAACYGTGLSLLMPTFNLLLSPNDQGEERKLVVEQLQSDDAPDHAKAAAKWLNDHPIEKKHLPPLQEVIDRRLNKKNNPEMVRNFAQWAIASLPDDSFNNFLMVMAAISVLIIVGSVGRYVHELLVVTVVFRAGQVWRKRVFARLIQGPVDAIYMQGYADNMSRIISDTNQLALGFQAVLGKTVAELLKGAAALTVAFCYNPGLTMFALITAPIIGLLLRKFGKRIRRASKKVLEERGRMLAMLNEALGGLSVVKVHDAQGFERRRFHRLNRDLMTQQMRARQARALASPVVESLALFAVIAVASVAAWLIYRRGFPPSDFMVVLVSLAAAGASIKPLSSLNNDLSEAGSAATRVLEAANMPIEPMLPEVRSKLPTLARHEREIIFEDVSYRYPTKNAPAVDHVTLKVRHGQTVAIVGGNGAGKTTLLCMLPRLIAPQVPMSGGGGGLGKVFIDGVDIASVNLRSLREQMAMVTQQNMLFEGTIAQNIAYGRRYETTERIIAAAKAAFADEYIRALPKGYDTMLGEGGSGLSGGQRQRLCIARAILRDPSILILDEATSQVDADSEEKITRALSQLRQGRTTFIIAHRLSTVVDSDLIVVMDHGRIVDMDKHAALLTRCEIYRLLTRTQLQNSVA